MVERGMRRALVLVTVGCAARSTPPPPPAPPVPMTLASDLHRTCSDAAAGLERATVGLRAPDRSILATVRARCVEDTWTAAAVECFSAMTGDDLGACAAKLDRRPREALFAVLGDVETDKASVTLVLARLASLRVGIATCDQFVVAVSNVMRCEQLPLDTRVQLGSETADFWSLPTTGLPEDAQAKMEAACGESLAALERESSTAGCRR